MQTRLHVTLGFCLIDETAADTQATRVTLQESTYSNTAGLHDFSLRTDISWLVVVAITRSSFPVPQRFADRHEPSYFWGPYRQDEQTNG